MSIRTLASRQKAPSSNTPELSAVALFATEEQRIADGSDSECGVLSEPSGVCEPAEEDGSIVGWGERYESSVDRAARSGAEAGGRLSAEGSFQRLSLPLKASAASATSWVPTSVNERLGFL